MKNLHLFFFFSAFSLLLQCKDSFYGLSPVDLGIFRASRVLPYQFVHIHSNDSRKQSYSKIDPIFYVSQIITTCMLRKIKINRKLGSLAGSRRCRCTREVNRGRVLYVVQLTLLMAKCLMAFSHYFHSFISLYQYYVLANTSNQRNQGTISCYIFQRSLVKDFSAILLRCESKWSYCYIDLSVKEFRLQLISWFLLLVRSKVMLLYNLSFRLFLYRPTLSHT